MWLAQSLRNNDTDSHVLLQENAVGYALTAQDAGALKFRTCEQTQPPRLQEDLARLHASGARVFVVEEHLKSRGIRRAERIENLEIISETTLPALLENHDLVFQW